MVSTTKEQTRLRLLESAQRLMLERGFHNVGLEDIAAAAGVSRQAVYKSHYASKAELLLDLVRHVHVTEKLDELTEPIRHAKSGLDMLELTIVAAVRIEERVHELSVVMSAAALTDPGAAAAWRDRMTGKRDVLRAALERTRTEGHLASTWTVEEGIDLIMALTSVDTYQQLVVDRGWKPDALIARVRGICADALLLQARRGKQPRH
jgi:AcrR family transcriptional regulator